MSKYLKLFENHAQYETFIGGGVDLPNVSHCIDNNDVHYNPLVPQHDYSQDYLTFEILENGTIGFTYTNNVNSESGYIEYSIDDGQTWIRTNNVQSEEINVTLNVSNGDKILWRGDNPTLGIEDEWLESAHFSTTCHCNVMGNVMSILYGDDFKNQYEVNNYALMGLFTNLLYWEQSCYIVNAENLILPATTLAYYCYTAMFYGCTSLETAPELPATTLESSCYSSMFQGCTNLTTAPELPATKLESDCYSGMFYDCTSLVNAPVLPATTLVNNCYNSMFQGCTSLNYIKAMFTTTPSSSYTDYWMDGVAENGTFVKNSAAQWDVTGVEGIPDGWTVQTASE